ncbi:DUF5710 domain-containing protein [Paracidovorax citrulli]
MDTTEQLPTSEAAPTAVRRGRRYIFVPYDEKDKAATLGARFDGIKKRWYVPAGVDDRPFERWHDEPRELSESQIIDQFARACEEAGLVLTGSPEMDGAWHKTTVSTSSNERAKKGAYRATLSGDAPNGFIVNFDSGYSAPWRPEGLILSDEDRDKNRRLSEENRLQREKATIAEQETAARRAAERWSRLPPAQDDHPYLVRKQVQAFGLRLDGDRLVTALRDVDGRIHSLQWIDPRGGKLYEKGGQKTGNFHVLGDLSKGKTVLFAEGYSTCGSLHMATGLPVVEVFDSGNLEAVMSKLAPVLPGRLLIACSDDDVLTRDRIIRTINRTANSEFAKPRLLLESGIADDEVVIDGTARPLRGNPDCTLRLAYELSPEGVQRIVGEIVNTTKKQPVSVRIVNVGREKALAAAAKVAGVVALFPEFQSLQGSPTDFNDLHVREGLTVVRRQVGAAMLARSSPAVSEKTPLDVAQAALGARAVLTDPKDDSQYVGPVVGNTPSCAVQSVGRQNAVTHDLGRLDKIPAVGQPTKIAYRGGQGRVEQPPLARDVGRDR